MSSDIGAWEGGSLSSDPWDYGGAKGDVEWRETEEGHIFRLDLPGVGKEDVKVEVEVEDGNFLHISGGGSVVKVEGGDEGRRVERLSGSFSRRFRLPENAEVEGMKCGLEDGVLTVEMGKKEVHHHPTNVTYIHVA